MLAYHDLSDEELARNADIGRREWIDELYRRYERRMFGCAHRMVAPGEVEDAVQEIALRVIRGLPNFRGDSSIGTWIYAVARHTCLDIRRRRRDTTELPDAEVLDDGSPTTPQDAFDTSVMACRTAMAIAALPAGQRDVVMLRLGAGLSTEETAARLETTVDSVKARLRRARQALRRDLGETMHCPDCGPGTYTLDGAGLTTEPISAGRGG